MSYTFNIYDKKPGSDLLFIYTNMLHRQIKNVQDHNGPILVPR